MKKSAKGIGTIRKKTVTRNGKPYTYWESRVTVGRDPGTGKQIQRSFTGKTQKEVREKMQAAAVEVNQGTYTAPSKLTVGQWLDIWQRDYLGAVKPFTVQCYERSVRLYIRPALGAIKLEAQAEAIKAELKADLEEKGVEELKTKNFILRWKEIVSNRIDSKALKAALPDVYGQFCKASVSRRFTVA